MQTQVTFQANDTIAQAILAILKNFSSSDVKVIEESHLLDKPQSTQSEALLNLEELYGSLKPYVEGYLSDDDIQNAIDDSAIESGMAGRL